MCFSAPASFIAGSALLATGVTTRNNAKRKDQLLFASMPLLFGIQQIFDGIAWTSAASPALHTIAAYGFAFFAYVLWPVYVPLAVVRMEKNRDRRALLRIFLILGGVASVSAFANMLSGPVIAEQVNRCIVYTLPHPYPWFMLVLYLFATCGSLMSSSDRFVRTFGLAVLISSGVAALFYTQLFASVWCFFAAVLSGAIYWHEKRVR